MGRRSDPAAAEEQARRAFRAATRESVSVRRLAAVWAERDTEIEARLKEVPEVAYKFTCKHCGSRFSLAQELEEHEAECGRAGSPEEPAPPPEEAKARTCKYCGQVFQNFGEYGAHRWAAHKKEVLEELHRRRDQRKADEAKIDSAIHGQPGKGRRTAHPQRAAPAGDASTRGATCPTCGGLIPATTAQLIKELSDLGIAEPQAFEAARIARQIFGGRIAG
jgi:PHP family Zn ribbon phosphoesterase